MTPALLTALALCFHVYRGVYHDEYVACRRHYAMGSLPSTIFSWRKICRREYRRDLVHARELCRKQLAVPPVSAAPAEE